MFVINGYLSYNIKVDSGRGRIGLNDEKEY